MPTSRSYIAGFSSAACALVLGGAGAYFYAEGPAARSLQARSLAHDFPELPSVEYAYPAPNRETLFMGKAATPLPELDYSDFVALGAPRE